MSVGRRYDFSEEQEERRRHAARLSWLSLILLASTAVLTWLTLGQSQAMKTAWAEDLLGMIPPVAVLLALRVENREPTARFPFGYFRSVSVAFLASAAALCSTGLWLFGDAL